MYMRVLCAFAHVSLLVTVRQTKHFMRTSPSLERRFEGPCVAFSFARSHLNAHVVAQVSTVTRCQVSGAFARAEKKNDQHRWYVRICKGGIMATGGSPSYLCTRAQWGSTCSPKPLPSAAKSAHHEFCFDVLPPFSSLDRLEQ